MSINLISIIIIINMSFTDQPVYIVNDTFTFTEGDRVRIELQLDANPLPIIFEWFFNGLPLPLMPGLDLGRDVIDISIATILDTGNYTVTSTNAAGSGSGNFMLVIESKQFYTNYACADSCINFQDPLSSRLQ